MARKKPDDPSAKNETTPARTSARSWPHGPNPPRESVRTRITPEIATEWLKANMRNRALSRTYLDTLKADMRAGRFVFNGDPVVWSWHEVLGWVLASGQHRLIASVETWCAFDAPVVFVDHNARKHVGTGRRCSPPQAWMRETGVMLPNWSVARINAAWQGLRCRDVLRTPEQFGNAYERFREGLEAMQQIFKSHRAVTSQAPYVAAFLVAYYESPEVVTEMARLFELGAGFEPRSAVHTLHQWATTGGGKRARDPERFNKALGLIAAQIDGKNRSQTRENESVIDRFRMAVGLADLTP